MPQNVPAYSARNKQLNSLGLTNDVNADSRQIKALTDFVNGLPAGGNTTEKPLQRDNSRPTAYAGFATRIVKLVYDPTTEALISRTSRPTSNLATDWPNRANLIYS